MDAAIDMQDEINRYLRQPVEQPSTLADAREGLIRLHQQYQRTQWKHDDVRNPIFDWPRCCGSAKSTRDQRRELLAEAQRSRRGTARQLTQLDVEQRACRPVP